MNRTGVEQNRADEIVALVNAIAAAGLEFRGLHYYDGQYGGVAEPERTKAAHEGYGRLLNVVNEIERGGRRVLEVITAGTATFPCSLSYPGFSNAGFMHRISPGTVVYGDATSLALFPKQYGYQPAVLVLSRLVSRPSATIATCDAGHKSVSADAGVPTCVVVGHPELTPRSPSEEHLPMVVQEGVAGPRVGDLLYLLPRHICPTVNNFDWAVLVRGGSIDSVHKVSARGREAPLLPTALSAVSAND
jgi:D-serine deaminase-like pyridoxal phosphate-dependent protein